MKFFGVIAPSQCLYVLLLIPMVGLVVGSPGKFLVICIIALSGLSSGNSRLSLEQT